MDGTIIDTIIADALWLLVFAGWVLLLITGLETDKPLSGGIPGHVSLEDKDQAAPEGLLSRLGTLGAWLGFGLVCATLPVVLWWIFLVHPR